MSKTLRGAVIGYGFIAETGHVPGYLKRRETQGDIEIVAVADTCAARREAAHRALPHARIYPDHASLLAAEGHNLDFVDIATPPSEHGEIAHAALDRGLHVLCEKPLACSTQEARQLLEHAARAKRVLMPCHNYRHAPVVQAVRRILDEDRIGQVHLVTLNTFRNTHARGVADWRPDWRREREWSGGGIAMDHGSHTFYLAFDWLGSYPTSVTAHMSTLGDWDTEDNFSCTLRFPTGVAVAELTWNAGMRKVIYTIHGSRGAITVNDDEIEVITMGQPNEESGLTSLPRLNGASKPNGKNGWHHERTAISSDWMDASHVTWFGALIDELMEAIETGDFVGRSAIDALMCVNVIKTSYTSAQAGSMERSLASGVETETARARLVS